MAVNLRKPEASVSSDIREITPVHICDEVYPNKVYTPVAANADVVLDYNKDTAEYLKNILVNAAQVAGRNDNDAEGTCYDLQVFFGKKHKTIANIAVENNHVVYLHRSSLISKKYKVVTCDFLDALQLLLIYLERSDATFDGLCDFLDEKWAASRDKEFYIRFCDFLSDIKVGNISSIESVLTGAYDYCYSFLLAGAGKGNTDCSDVFMAELNTRLYHALYELLKREVEINVHPLFLFACQNFYAKPAGDYSKVSIYHQLNNQRAALEAYGRTLNGVLLEAKPRLPKFFDWLHCNSEDLYGLIAGVPAGIGLLMLLAGCMINTFSWLKNPIPDMLAFLQFNTLMCIGLGGIALGGVDWLITFILHTAYLRRIASRENTFLYGGLQCFLNAHKGSTHTILQQLAVKMPHKVRKKFLPEQFSLSEQGSE